MASTPDSAVPQYASTAIVIYGPQGCGKTRNAAALAAHFGKTLIVDPYVPGMPLPPHAIALTNDPACAGAALNFYRATEESVSFLSDELQVIAIDPDRLAQLQQACTPDQLHALERLVLPAPESASGLPDQAETGA